MNVYMSLLFAVVVLIGTVPAGNLTDAGQVIVLPAVPSFVKSNENDDAPFPGLENVKVQFPVRVAVTKVPLFKLMVVAVPVFPMALTSSPTLTNLRLPSITVLVPIKNDINYAPPFSLIFIFIMYFF
jgi:hypothetical protein